MYLDIIERLQWITYVIDEISPESSSEWDSRLDNEFCGCAVMVLVIDTLVLAENNANNHLYFECEFCILW